MIVFLDESGDAGFKLGQGSSRFFVISLVIFERNKDAERVSARIKDLHEQLQHRSEFKFSKTRQDVRLQFLEAMRDQPFTVRSLIVDKSQVNNETLRHDQEAFYFTFVRQVLERNRDHLQNAKLRIDGSSGRDSGRKFISELRQSMELTLADIKFRDSASEPLIQLADMVAGATRYAYDPERLDSRFHDRFQHKVEDDWMFR